ncbi:MAG: alpha/beta hydrolase [Sandaracinaceae bacterium]|nr:alpha/beta hydrolase [Sandaracinaceae bacterium]
MRRTADYPFRSAQAREEYLAFYDRRAERWPVPSETRTVPTSFGETFVRISGPAEAPALVLLPGMSSSGWMWETLVEPFARRYRTYAVDSVSDVGRSVPARDLRSAADYAEWLEELFEALDLREVSLMGMSYGAWITANMALLRPERLRRTVWLAPAGVVARLSILWVILALLTGISKWIHRRFTYWMFADAVKTEDGRRIAEELIADTQVMIRCYAPRPMVAPSRLSDAQLGSIRVPTLLLIGEHETVGSPSSAMRRIRKVAPQIEAELVRGAGHDLPIAQPELVIRRVLAFLEAP